MKSYFDRFDEYLDIPQGICERCEPTVNFVYWVYCEGITSCKCWNCGFQEVITERHNCNSYVCAKERL
jgi:hypothetical protein